MFQTVLFPIDHSRQAAETAATALKLAQQHDSHLVVLSVVEADPGVMHDPAAVAQLLEQARSSFVEAGVPTQVIERQGNPAFVICDVADEINADLIVMGTRGLTLEADSHSTAARVIQLAPCPVLVVP
jgi:nucleotide-binding universal stress UspA family protein